MRVWGRYVAVCAGSVAVGYRGEDTVHNVWCSSEDTGGKSQTWSLTLEQIGTWGLELRRLVLQPPDAPVLLRLTVDFHVSITGFDLIEHPGGKGREEEGRSWRKHSRMKTICWFTPKHRPNSEWEFPLLWLVLLTCHTVCRGRSWPMAAREPPPPDQTVCPLADRWVLPVKTGPIMSLSCIPHRIEI